MTNKEYVSEYSDEKYQARRDAIEKSDQEIVKIGKEKSNSFPHATAPITWGAIQTLSLVLGDRLSKYPLVDIGGGEWGFDYVVGVQEDSDGDCRIPKYVDVEPYGICVEKSLSEGRETELVQDKRDGLTYLLDQQEKSGNVICSSINYSLIPSDDYLKRIAQEIYRTVPEDGLFITTDSDEISEEAEKLFPYSTVVAYQISIFSKKPLPSKKIIGQCWSENGRDYLKTIKGLFEERSLSGEILETHQEIDVIREEIRAVGFEMIDISTDPEEELHFFKVRKKEGRE